VDETEDKSDQVSILQNQRSWAWSALCTSVFRYHMFSRFISRIFLIVLLFLHFQTLGKDRASKDSNLATTPPAPQSSDLSPSATASQAGFVFVKI